MDDIRITINNNLSVTIYDFNRESEIQSTLIDTVEKYFKNKRIRIREIVVNKNDITQSQINLISLLKNDDTIVNSPVALDNNNSNDLFEAQILIPYRARYPNTFREKQLHKFLEHINVYFSTIHPTLRYKLIIIEQNNDHMFNRGLLLNIGFLEREKDIDYRIKYYVHHNCDLFPNIEQNPPLDYSFTPVNEVRDIFGYSGGIGGIAIFNRKTFFEINGFPNDYFNWGAEDTTLHKRCERNSIDIKRTLYNVGITEESHSRDSSYNDINSRKGDRDNPTINGLTTCKYTCTVNEETNFKYDNIIHYLVDFDYNSK